MFVMYLRLPGHPNPSAGEPEASSSSASHLIPDQSQGMVRSAQIQQQERINQLRQLQANQHLERHLFW